MKAPTYFQPTSTKLILANAGLTFVWLVATILQVVCLLVYYITIYPVKKIGPVNILKGFGWLLYYIIVFPLWSILKWIFKRITKVADTALNQFINVLIKWILPILIILLLIMFRHQIYQIIK